jgi:hypothetical protein
MPSSNNTSGEHQIYEVVGTWGDEPWSEFHGTKYFSVYWTHGRTGLKYVFPNIAARDELEAYTIALKKLDTGDH